MANGSGVRLLNPALPAASLGLMIFLMRYNTFWSDTLGITFASLCAAWLILVANGGNWLDRLLSLPFLVYIGKISYALYLWHYPILMLGGQVRFAGWLQHLYVISLLLLSFGIAALSYAVVETPFLNLKRRFAANALAPLSPGAALSPS